MERKNFAQLHIDGRYVGVIEVVSEAYTFILFREIGHRITLQYLPKREGIKVINFKNVEV
ncbi:hypothetical protein PM116P6_00044 [Parabacteroides phage PM116P6]|nr:hypothetical protein PM116P6_00044 [Parabacteroides phage PM116P6]WAX17621.1 hypothetical protein PM116P7_00006 [Parabacteroides phage PM116P7]